jgi:hypothetical protein
MFGTGPGGYAALRMWGEFAVKWQPNVGLAMPRSKGNNFENSLH